jgi:hypothetical protein
VSPVFFGIGVADAFINSTIVFLAEGASPEWVEIRRNVRNISHKYDPAGLQMVLRLQGNRGEAYGQRMRETRRAESNDVMTRGGSPGASNRDSVIATL